MPEAMPESRDVRLRADSFGPGPLGDLRVDANTLALYRDVSASGAPGRVRLVVEPDGCTGRFWINDATSAGFFTLGGPLRGSIGFRAIVGRNCHVAGVRAWQMGTDGVRREVIDDGFDREKLGSAWVVEGGGLSVDLSGGELILTHDGSMKDSWVRLARELEFEGSTTYFECEITKRSGRLENNPSLVLGVGDGGRVDKGMLVDFTDAGPTSLYISTGGKWQHEGVTLLPAPVQIERVELPVLGEGEARTARQLQPAGGTLHPRGVAAHRHVLMAWRAFLRQPLAGRRDEEVPRHHARRVRQDRKGAVRQNGARLLHRRAALRRLGARHAGAFQGTLGL